MSPRLRELWSFIKAQGAGLTSVAVDWGILWLCINLLDGDYRLAVVAGNLGGAITEFTLKRYLVFEGGTHLPLRSQAGRYAVVSLFSAGLNALTSWGVIGLLGMPKFPWILITSTFGGLLWTYPMHRYWVYRPSEPSAAASSS